MADTTDYRALARIAYDHASNHYGDKDARYDVIVECMGIGEIADELKDRHIITGAGAKKWADETAGLQHERELNQAWDGPESCIGSSSYDPDADPSNY